MQTKLNNADPPRRVKCDVLAEVHWIPADQVPRLDLTGMATNGIRLRHH
jgi:hypothetical protein